MEKFGAFEVLKVDGSSGTKTVFLFHGYGANAQDLFSLHQFLVSSNVKSWIFPEGVLLAKGVPMGRAWFPIDVEALERALSEGRHREYSGPVPQKLVSVRQMFLQSLQEMGLKPQDCIVGGFSQGAMLATDIALNCQEDFAGLVILSGAFIGQEEWPKLASQKKMKFFQSHGRADAILSHAGAKSLYDGLLEKGWKGEFESFPGGHEIPENVIYKLKHFISSL